MSVEEVTPKTDEQPQPQQEPPQQRLAEFYLIPGPLAQATLNYLSQRPYAEVAGLIQGLMNDLQEVNSVTPAAKSNRANKRSAARSKRNK